MNRNIGESAGEQWMREHGMGAGYTNPVFQQMPAQDQFSSNLDNFVSGLPWSTRAHLTPFGNGQFYYYTYQGRAYRSNYDNISGRLSVTGYGELRLTDASYQYGNSIGERASNFSFWWDLATNGGAFADDPNIIKMDIGDNPVSWLISGAGVLAAAKGLGAARLSTNSVKLAQQLASQAQMSETGIVLIRNLKVGPQLAKQYGGKTTDWVKKTSSSFSRNTRKFETHWYENMSTGQRVEFKTKLIKGW